MTFRDTDLVILGARNEDDVSHLEVQTNLALTAACSSNRQGGCRCVNISALSFRLQQPIQCMRVSASRACAMANLDVNVIFLRGCHSTPSVLSRPSR